MRIKQGSYHFRATGKHNLSKNIRMNDICKVRDDIDFLDSILIIIMERRLFLKTRRVDKFDGGYIEKHFGVLRHRKNKHTVHDLVKTFWRSTPLSVPEKQTHCSGP